MRELASLVTYIKIIMNFIEALIDFVTIFDAVRKSFSGI